MLFFPISGVRMLGFVTLLYDKSKNMFTFLNTNFCVIRTIVLKIALLLFFKFQIKGFRVKYITELFFPLELLGKKKNLNQSYMMREPSHIVRKRDLP